jgi:hypothetical protein
MSSIKKEFSKQLKTLDRPDRPLIENFTKRCALYTKNAREIADAVFQEFQEVFS